MRATTTSAWAVRAECGLGTQLNPNTRPHPSGAMYMAIMALSMYSARVRQVAHQPPRISPVTQVPQLKVRPSQAELPHNETVHFSHDPLSDAPEPRTPRACGLLI